MKLTPLDPWTCRIIGAIQPVVSRSELEAWQLQKLNETLKLVRTRSSFYQKSLCGLPETIGCLTELQQFPFTTPEDIQQNPLQFVCVSQSDIKRVVTLQSSGTTGEPKRIYFTADDQQMIIDFFGIGMATFTNPGEKVLILLPCETPGSVGDLLRSGLTNIDRIPLAYGPVQNPHHVLEMMRSLQPDCLVGSPIQVLGLARRWNPENTPPHAILLSTDYVPTAIVHELENIWGCRVFNHYGTTEMGLGGCVECEARSGYHLREVDLFFEVVDPVSGKPVPEGEYGEVVFSTLTRHGMPLIRYRTGDRSRFITDPCPCGTALRTMEKVSGRFVGLISVEGKVLKQSDFDEALFAIPGLLGFSVTILDDESKTFLIVKTQMLSDFDSTHLVEKALQTIPSIRNLEVLVQCEYNPDEVGSLKKRGIFDKRGTHA